MEKDLILLRGLPGCGKSTLAKLLNGYTCTADDYHMKDGVYMWKAENTSKAHDECQRKCEKYMELDMSPVIIANTSTTEKELESYYKMAKKYKYKVFSLVVENRHNGKNEHNVPEETIKKMTERFQIKLI
jgi:predicted kinase